MTRLSRLYLYGNSLSSLTLPGDLESLQELDIGGNSLRELNLPASLTSLQRLNLSENHLRSLILPEGLTNLKVLELDLNYNYIGSRHRLVSLIVPFGLDVSNLQVSGFSKADIARYYPHFILPYPGLQIAVRQALKKGEAERLTAEDLKGLTELDASQLTSSKRPPVRNLQGLEMATNLTSLNLNGNGLTSLTLPAGLVNLKTLNLTRNSLRELTLPTDLTRLETLYLTWNDLSELTLPKGMTNLKKLSIRDNPLKKLRLLADLTSLNTLSLMNNNLASLILPGGMPHLRRLYLNGNPINRLAVPQGMNIDNLRISGFSKSNIAFYDLETSANATLAILRLGDSGLTISWSGGRLQSSADLLGNWEDVEIGESPCMLRR